MGRLFTSISDFLFYYRLLNFAFEVSLKKALKNGLMLVPFDNSINCICICSWRASDFLIRYMRYDSLDIGKCHLKYNYHIMINNDEKVYT